MNIENREISIKILNSIEELRKSINSISVYDFNIYSSMELYYTIANKLNEVVTECNRYEIAISEEIINQNNCLQYLLNEGLMTELSNKIDNLILDGTMDRLLNHKIFSSLNKKIEDYSTTFENLIDNIDDKKADKSMIGTPYTAPTASAMRETTKIYVYTGSESGYVNGDWYYHNGTNWVSGGSYNSQAIGNFGIDNIKIKALTSDKMNFNRYSHINEGTYKLSKLSGIDSATKYPIFSASSSIACVTLDLTNFVHDDLYFKMSNISGQVAVFYTPNKVGGNLTYTNIVDGNNSYFVYDSSSSLCKVDVTSLKASYNYLVVAMDINYCSIYSTSKSIIGEKQIKDNSITLKHIKDKEILKDSNSISTCNYFDINLCEEKYSRSYDTSANVPIWQTNNDTSKLYRTITIPVGSNGYITLKKPKYYDITMQLYFLSKDNNVKAHFTNKQINETTNVYPYNLYNFTEVTEDYLKVDCSIAKNSEIEYMTVTYNYDSEILENNVYINYEKSLIPDWLDTKKILEDKTTNTDIEIVLPSKYLVCANKDYDIHFNNVVRYYNTDNAQKVVMNGQFKNFKKFSKISPTDSMSDFGAVLRFYKDDTKNITQDKNISIRIVKSTDGSGTKKVLVIGDSYTANGTYTSELINLFGNDSSMNIELIGTLGSGVNKHEGRAGWRAHEYVNNASGVYGYSGTNAFYNPSTLTFDFSYYMNNNGFSNVDIVCINLGTNDLARADYSTTTIMINSYDYMINSIKTYNPNIKILIGLPATRALGDLENKSQIDSALESTKALIEAYDNKESDNIYLVPYYLNIDPNNDFNFSQIEVSSRNTNTKIKVASDTVHPSTLGYYKIADVIYSYIKYASK